MLTDMEPVIAVELSPGLLEVKYYCCVMVKEQLLSGGRAVPAID